MAHGPDCYPCRVLWRAAYWDLLRHQHRNPSPRDRAWGELWRVPSMGPADTVKPPATVVRRVG